MISSPQPNKATPDSDSKGHKDGTTTITEPFPLSTQERPEQNFQKSHLLDTGDLPEQKQTHQNGDRRWWQRLSLRSKATVLAIALGTIPVLALGTINYFSASRDIRENVIGLQKSVALSLGDELGRFMFERYADVQTLAGLRAFSDPSVSAITSRQEKETQLNRFVQVYKLYDNIAVFNLNGDVIAQSKGEASRNVLNENYFQTVLKTNSAFISQPTVSKATGLSSIYITAPIKNSDTNETIAVMRTRMPVNYLNKLLAEETERLSTGFQALSQNEYHLVDGNGKIFVAQEEEELGADANAEISGFAQIQAAKQVTARINLDQNDKVKQVVAYAPIQQVEETPELNWSLLLAEPVDIAFAAQQGCC